MNSNKTISANSKGINISFVDKNKHKFVYYNGKRYQMENPKYQIFEEPEFNKTQRKIYLEAVYGLQSIPHEKVMEMSKSEIIRINDVHTRAKYIINNFKQELSSTNVDNLLSKLFSKSPIVKQMLNIKGVDPSIKCLLTIKDLKITEKMIAEKLIQFKVLPENFFNLV